MVTFTLRDIGVDIGEHKSKVSAVYQIELFTIRVHNRAQFCMMINTRGSNLMSLCFDQNYIYPKYHTNS